MGRGSEDPPARRDALMDQIIDLVVERSGISREQAEKAIAALTGLIKDRPELLSSFLGGGEGGAPDLGDLGKQLGGLFGRK